MFGFRVWRWVGVASGVVVVLLLWMDDGAVLVELDAAWKRPWPWWRGEGTARVDVALLVIGILLELVVIGVIKYLEFFFDRVPS